MTVELRNISELDKDLLFKWRNNPEIVERSTSQKEVSYTEHSDWFDKMCKDEDVLPFIVDIDGESSGHARLEKDNKCCVVTIYLLNPSKGKGYGTQAINLVCGVAFQKWKALPIVAFIRSDNHGAQAAFEKAGFQLSSITSPDDHISMMLDKSAYEELHTAKHYNKRMDEYGDAYESLNWGSKEGQELRFKILAEIGDLNGKSILDVGCGLGDFASWLKKNNISVDYTGIDITEKFITVAKEKHPEYQFFTQSISEPPQFNSKSFDYVFASGIFATYALNGDEWLQQCVEAMWGFADKGVAFNSLSSWADEKDDSEYYAEPGKVLSMAKDMTSWVVLKHDYHPRDMTFYMMRNKRV